MAFWINTVSRDHVLAGIEGGFTQADHGRQTTLRRLRAGDLVAFYSPRTTYPDGDRLQAFSAVGRVIDNQPYQVEMTPAFRPWRRRLEFLPADEAPIAPLLDDLELIPNRRSWGFVFRRGLFEIGAADFERIAAAMHVQASIDSAQG